MRKSLNHRSLVAAWQREHLVLTPALALFCLVAPCWGQGTMSFRFEGQPRGTTFTLMEYAQSGMSFRNPYGPQPLVLSGGGMNERPENGTGYLQVTTGAKLVFGFYTFPGTPFSFVSFDAAGYLTNFTSSVALHVIGYKGMNVAVTNDFTVNSILDRRANQLADFETFYLDSRFVDLYRVEILSDRFSIDNVLVSGVPEPSACALVLLGAACAFGRSWIRIRRP